MVRKEIVYSLVGLAIFGALTGLLLEIFIEGDAAKFRQFAQKIKSNTLVLFETAQMQTVQNMISQAEVGFELSKTHVDPDMISNTGDEYFLNQVSGCVFSSPEDIPFSTCLICQLSDQECKPKEDCPECEKPTIFTVRYDNPSFPDDLVTIEVYKKEGDFGEPDKILAEFFGVMDGDEITIDSRDFINDDKDTVHSNTAYRVIIAEDEIESAVTIHTSCSQPLFVGDVHNGAFGVSFTVISGTDENGFPTIPDQSCKDPTCPECEKPHFFTVRYDNPTHPLVDIEVYKKMSDFGDASKILVQFSGVMDGDEITIDGSDFNSNGKVNSDTSYRVLVDGQELGGVQIHTSCSQPLFVGDVHTGANDISFTVISGTDENGNPTIPNESCTENGNDSLGVNVLVEGKKILPDGYIAGTTEIIPLPLGSDFPQNEIQKVHCVVLKVCSPPGEGCTPGYWKQEQHLDSWVFYIPSQTVGSVFDQATSPEPFGKTLRDALEFGGSDFGQEGKLLRAAVAAILNAASPDVDYPVDESDIIDQVNSAIASGDDTTMEDLKDVLDDANNLGCPLN